MRSEEQSEKYFNADISDDETDVFRCHINEIDHVYLLDAKDAAASTLKLPNQTNTIPTDPRTGKIYPKFLVDHSKAAEPKLFSAFPIKSKLPPWMHNSCIRAIVRIRNRLTDGCRSGNAAPMSIAECKDLETYTASWEKRQNEQTVFQEFVKMKFLSNVGKLIEKFNPIDGDKATESWKQSLMLPRTGHYTIQTALPLDSESKGNVTLNVEAVVSQNGTVVECSEQVSNKWCRPSLLQTETLTALDFNFKSINYEAIALQQGANIVLSIEVLSKLLDYPNNCIDSWNIPFEVKYFEDLSCERICFFDEVLPQAFLSKLERNKQAISRQVQSCTIKQRDCKTFNLGTRLYGRLLPENEAVCENSNMEYKVNAFSKYMRNSQNGSLEPPHILRLATLEGNEHEAVKLLIGQSIKTYEPSNSGEPLLINVSTKLEYQTQFGAEQMSATELIDEWCAQHFQPDSFTDRCKYNLILIIFNNIFVIGLTGQV